MSEVSYAHVLLSPKSPSIVILIVNCKYPKLYFIANHRAPAYSRVMRRIGGFTRERFVMWRSDPDCLRDQREEA